MAVNGGYAGTKKGPNWGHVNFRSDGTFLRSFKEFLVFVLSVFPFFPKD